MHLQFNTISGDNLRLSGICNETNIIETYSDYDRRYSGYFLNIYKEYMSNSATWYDIELCDQEQYIIWNFRLHRCKIGPLHIFNDKLYNVGQQEYYQLLSSCQSLTTYKQKFVEKDIYKKRIHIMSTKGYTCFKFNGKYYGHKIEK